METVSLDYLKQLIREAQQLRANAAFSEPDAQDAQITYLPCTPHLKYIGNWGSPEHLLACGKSGMFGCKEQGRKPFGRSSYYRIVQKDGRLLRIDNCFFGTVQATRLFTYTENRRYCFTFQRGKAHCEPYTEAVIFDGERISAEYRVQDNGILYRQYFYEDTQRVRYLCMDYFPFQEPALRRHSEGIYSLGKSPRRKETFLWLAGDSPDPGDNYIREHTVVDFTKKILWSFALLILLAIPMLFMLISFSSRKLWPVVRFIGKWLIPGLVFTWMLSKNRSRTLRYCAVFLALFAAVTAVNVGYIHYDESITIDTAPNIDVSEYLPFDPSSKIVRLSHKASIELTGELPVLDGAAAVFPVYSSFVDALYPETTRLYDGTFEYNNTVFGYKALAQRKTDIFFGAYPSEEQIAYAREQGTEFSYTPIAMDAFVFFVHKDNPIDNLTSEQIRGIYSGQITNWAQLGGSNIPISPYQRNEGSGSQSMLIRFMGDTPIMEPEIELIDTMMSGIIEQVADYRSKPGSIGFSFRYYVEGIIQNPDIKLLSIDGVAPTVENIQSGAYPITGPLYAVTWKGNDNPNVALLLDWILSEEGQWIIAETGYVPLDIQLCLPQ